MRVGCWRLSARIRNLLESHSVHRAVAPAGCRPELSGLRRLSVADRRAIGAASRQQQNCQQLRLCLKGCHRKVTGSVQFGFIRLTRLLLASALTLLWPDGAVALDRKLVHPLAQERELWVDHQIRRGPGEALPRHYPAVAKSELGVEEAVDARSLNNLAMVYHDQGRYAEAEPLYQRSLKMLEETFGSDHPAVAATLSNLAALYQDQGRYAEAERLCQRSVAILEKAFGPEHLQLAAGLHNLALVYEHQGRNSEAELLYRRTLTILERVLEPEHFGIASILNNLARVYFREGRDTEAEPLYRRSLAILEKTVGADHPAVAESLKNLADLYRNEGRAEEAETLYRRSEAIRAAVGGALKTCDECQ